MANEHPPGARRTPSPLKIALFALLGVAAILLVCLLAIVLYPDTLLNRYIKPRITEAFVEAYPEYSIRIADMSYSVNKNRLGCDSAALSAIDGTFSSSIGAFSVTGIDWMHLLWGGSLIPSNFANSVVEARRVVLNFPESQYELRCGVLRLSIPDSEIVVEALSLRPAVDDEQFFEESSIRKTRFIFSAQRCSLAGGAFLEALDRNSYRARVVRIHNMSIDVLINKDKPAPRSSASPPMPGEMLSSMKDTITCDSLDIVDAGLTYGERFQVGSKPAVITFDSMHVLAAGIANHGDRDAAVAIHAQGRFMKAGTMEMSMSIPVAPAPFSLQYSGSLKRMDIRALNVFLETAEQMRIKSGVLQTATFEINVTSGRATGTVRAVYRDLTLAVINKYTRSEKGFVDGLASFIANNFKILSTNVPEKSGAMKIGKVKYARQHDDPFFRFVWFALRSGVGDVVGF